MDIDATIAKISRFQRFGSKLGLERMEKLLDLLGNPQYHLSIINVFGNKDKGYV